MSGQYFEKQREQDCTVHALNNAAGREVITKEEVVAHIEKLVKEYVKEHQGNVSAKDLRNYRKRFSNKKTTFFTAEIVWMAARDLGRIEGWSPIYGFGGPSFSSVSYIKDTLPRHVVVLGIEPKGAHHAIAVRDGNIYDSLRKTPAPLTDAEMKKSLVQVLGAFAISVSGEENGNPEYFHYSGPAPVFYSS